MKCSKKKWCRKYFLFFLPVLFVSHINAAYLRHIPQMLRQPDGSILKCYASGDEFHNWFHDREGYTIIQDPETGYYVYADKTGETLIPSRQIAKSSGLMNPSGLEPYLNLSPKAILEKRNKRLSEMRVSGGYAAPNTGTINNIVIFIRFSDESEFTSNISVFEGKFNTNTVSLKSYYTEVSYNQLTVNTTFYPPAVDDIVASYQDSYSRNYYRAYNASTNPIGYQTDEEAASREHLLIRNAILAIRDQVPSGLNLDLDNDSQVDNVVFMVSGTPEGWNDLLWPHMWVLYSYNVTINGDRVYTYDFNFTEGGYSSVGVLCHEFFHSLGALDLYHYENNGISPVGSWDLMEDTEDPPQHMGAYMKYRYGEWIGSIPEITSEGMYTLNPVTSSSNNGYRIASPYSAQEYFVLEYRRDTGTFESSLPGSGLLVYRINTVADGDGNADGPPDEVYLYRPGGTTTVNGTVDNAHFSSDVSRTAIYDGTNPSPFLANGGNGGLVITEIGSAGSTIEFRVGHAPVSEPSIEVSPSSVSETLPQNGTSSRSVAISNVGESESVLTYSIVLSGNTVPSSFGSQPSVAGSTFQSNVSSYTPGTTFSLIFTVYNNSSDWEWLTAVSAEFPSGVTVNSSTHMTGGSAPLTTNGNTGDGVIVNWTDADGEFGNILGGESASATVNITVSSSFSGPLSISWEIYGDDFASAPHYVLGTLSIDEEVNEEAWVSVSPSSGTVEEGDSDVITLSFDATGLDPDTYSATMTISSDGGEDVAVPISLTVTSESVLNAPELTAIDIVNPSQARLTFSSVSGATGYHVYRGTTANFIPDTDGGSNRIGSSVTDQDGGTAGVQWTDTEGVAGSASINYFYRVTAVGSSQSAASNVMGIFDFELVTTSTTDFNEIGLPLVLTGVASASDLMDAIPNCNSVARWSASLQGYEQYIPGIPPTDFDVSMGSAYYVNVTTNGVFTLTGSVASTSFNLITTSKTDFNEVMLGLTKTSIDKASELMADISNCNSVARWSASLQGYEQYIPGIPPTDFDVSVGYPYYVNVTANSSWSLPGDHSEKKNQAVLASSAPHVVWGRLQDVPVAHFTAFLKKSPNAVITEKSAGSSLSDAYWMAQCAALSSGWAVGDTLMVRFFDQTGNVINQIHIGLTEQPADEVRGLDSVKSGATLPESHALLQNYPNPFNGSTQITFHVPVTERVLVMITDVQGRRVDTLTEGILEAGEHQVVWNGTNGKLQPVSSGIYFVLMQAGSFKQSRKILYIR